MTEASNQLIRPMPPILITQEFNPMPVPMPEQIEERISYPVFELLNEESIERTKNM